MHAAPASLDCTPFPTSGRAVICSSETFTEHPTASWSLRHHGTHAAQEALLKKQQQAQIPRQLRPEPHCVGDENKDQVHC